MTHQVRNFFYLQLNMNLQKPFETIQLYAGRLCVILLVMISLQCTPADSSAREQKTLDQLNQVIMQDSLVMPFPYDLTKPDRKIKLPPALAEVSALSYVKENELAMVQDENGIVFTLDLQTEKLSGKYLFKTNGDFEGVEILGDTAYALRSDGDIYQIIHYTQPDPEVIKYENILSQSDDTEGLGYDPISRSLMIVCKEPAYVNEIRRKDLRAVMRFDLQSLDVKPEPFVYLDLVKIHAFMLQHAKGQAELDKAREFNPQKAGSFKPSGIARHPVTAYIFVIASNGELMVVLNPDKEVVQVQPLPRDMFRQPEGICFSPNGDLYISNEGRGFSGDVLKFTYRPNL